MDQSAFQIGLVGYGLYLPQDFETAAAVAGRSGLTRERVTADLGIEGKCKPARDDQPIPMAVEAARQALSRAPGVTPGDIDVVIWTGEEYKDYIAQTASIRLQEEVGARKAWAFDLVGQGVTSLIGMRVARDMMMGDPSIRTVLLAGGTRNVDLVDYTNPHTRWMLATSASGGAMVLRRDYPRNLLLSIAIIVDSDMADEVYVPGGGTLHPFSSENLGTESMYFHVPHPEIVDDYLDRRMATRIVEVVQEAMATAGLLGRGPDYLALRHLRPHEQTRVLDAFDFRADQSDSLADVGHHGPNDVLISLDRGLRRGAIRDGARVALASGGIGFTYAAALLQWGPAWKENPCHSSW
jgi:3-oxoacyl-[acyl-carrier-protein] synthase-3